MFSSFTLHPPYIITPTFNVTLYEKEEVLIIQGTDALSLPSIPIPLFSLFTAVHYRIQIRVECGHNNRLRRNIIRRFQHDQE
jgi:hypothetical protein